MIQLCPIQFGPKTLKYVYEIHEFPQMTRTEWLGEIAVEPHDRNL